MEEIKIAKHQIEIADAVLITAGAGMGIVPDFLTLEVQKAFGEHIR